MAVFGTFGLTNGLETEVDDVFVATVGQLVDDVANAAEFGSVLLSEDGDLTFVARLRIADRTTDLGQHLFRLRTTLAKGDQADEEEEHDFQVHFMDLLFCV